MRAHRTWAFGVALALGLVAAGAAVRTLRVQSMTRYLETQTYEDVYYLPPPAWLPALSLGYREAAADLLWMKALIYFGTEAQHRGAVRHVYDYGEAILTLDPVFRRAYTWVGMAGIYRPSSASEADFHTGIEYLRRGVRAFPDDGELAWDLGATIMYELLPLVRGDARHAEREALRAEAVEHMQMAARLGAGPPYLGLVNASALTQLGRLDAARRHLEEIYASVRDPRVRRQIERAIERLSDEAHARALRAASRALEERHERDFPFVPLDLYVLVGPRPPVDEAGLLGRRFLPAEVAVGLEPGPDATLE